MVKQLVKLRTRPSRDSKTFVLMLDYIDASGKRNRESLGHADKRKAERQRAQKERELRMGIVVPERMRLSELLADSRERTRGQVRETTLTDRDEAMRHLIDAVGDIDVQEVSHRHAEVFIQVRLDAGNAPATVNKKVSALKRLFQLAVLRGQLETNPFRHVTRLKAPARQVRVFSEDECDNLLKAVREPYRADGPDWELLVVVALCTAMRRGELLNLTWADTDFDRLTVSVAPKQDTKHTWEWRIKDSERRTLPLTREVAELLKGRRTARATLHPYIFITASRHQQIQQRRNAGRWTLTDGRCPVNNFNRGFGTVLERAGIIGGEFHDLRRTCLSRWLANGLTEYDVMQLAGHSDFSTTHRFYLAVRSDLVDRARTATMAVMGTDFGAHMARAPVFG
ncbi:tyrosine-type recombinase/integrase [Anaerobaca lacustris]|uniref:Site-specific integrase n=1 Tax=Anaerobaca lacustris TaxID=3044600 RepID=A0AAW6U2T3_9BACT|nr:site-specific integrase [Sedimentisphaerales bacterium M17dextr]